MNALSAAKSRAVSKEKCAFNISKTEAWSSVGVAFVGGCGDAASFVPAKTFTRQVRS
jgi:hypothetical protein